MEAQRFKRDAAFSLGSHTPDVSLKGEVEQEQRGRRMRDMGERKGYHVQEQEEEDERTGE